MLPAVLNPDLYRSLKTLHILTAIVGFGAVMLNGVYCLRAVRLGGTEGLALSEAVYDVTKRWAAPFQYAVFLTGIVLVLGSDTRFGGLAWQFDQVWLSLSTVLYVGVIGLEHAVHRPNLRRMIELERELLEMRPLPAGSAVAQVGELEIRGRRAAISGAVLDVGVVAILAIMILKPAF